MAKRKSVQSPRIDRKATLSPVQVNQAAPEAAPPPPQQRQSIKSFVENLTYPLAFLTLGAISSPVSQSTLAPVFGAIPSAIHHKQAIVASALLAFALYHFLPRRPPQGRVAQWTAIWAFWIPVLESQLYRYSGTLGPAYGPALLGFLSCHTILIPSVYVAAEAFDARNLFARYGRWYAIAMPAAVGTWHIISAEAWFSSMLPSLAAVFDVVSPVSLQLMLAAVYTALAPSKLIVYALPTLLHTMYINPHFDSPATTSVLNSALHRHTWSLLDRRWSLTGYISVLENLDQQYRVLRCDHSLLGGEWLLTPSRQSEEHWTEAQSLYSAFDMLGAVRLIDRGSQAVPASQAQALVIGLGVGTAAKALVSHDINTTIVELDWVVSDYAHRYFGLPGNLTTITGDAVLFLTDMAADFTSHRYDYVIHDVFTGGAEPLSLFSTTFLQNLRKLLKPNGAVALNYAGDLSLPLTTRVLNTIDRTFAGQCTLYRDDAPTPSLSNKIPADANVHSDFANIVIFCRNAAGGPVTFLPPLSGDVAGHRSFARLQPDLEMAFPLRDSPNRTAALEDQILRSGEEHLWSAQQAESAIRHWHIMRSIIPDVVWELW